MIVLYFVPLTIFILILLFALKYDKDCSFKENVIIFLVLVVAIVLFYASIFLAIKGIRLL